MKEDLIRKIVEQVVSQYENGNREGPKNKGGIPVEVSARHIHLSQMHIEQLFGGGYELKKKRDISQPGQYICEERVTLIGPLGELKNVAVLGPPRTSTQVEISATDSRVLGVRPPLSMSGNLKNARDIYIKHGMAIVCAKSAVIIARNHLHITSKEAEERGLKNGQHIGVAMQTKRPITFDQVVVRADSNAKLAIHIDVDEANACLLETGDVGLILKDVQAIRPQQVMCEEAKIKASSPEIKERGARSLLSAHEVERMAKEGLKAIQLHKGTKITPLAKDLLREKKIEVRYL